MSTELLERPDTEIRLSTDEGDAECAHIVLVEPGEDAVTKVLEARVLGTPVTALCGYVWVPSKDPKQLPVCQKCADIYNGVRDAAGGSDPSSPLRPLDRLAEETA
jgi:hypothetical protein